MEEENYPHSKERRSAGQKLLAASAQPSKLAGARCSSKRGWVTRTKQRRATDETKTGAYARSRLSVPSYNWWRPDMDYEFMTYRLPNLLNFIMQKGTRPNLPSVSSQITGFGRIQIRLLPSMDVTEAKSAERPGALRHSFETCAVRDPSLHGSSLCRRFSGWTRC